MDTVTDLHFYNVSIVKTKQNKKNAASLARVTSINIFFPPILELHSVTYSKISKQFMKKNRIDNLFQLNQCNLGEKLC